MNRIYRMERRATRTVGLIPSIRFIPSKIFRAVRIGDAVSTTCNQGRQTAQQISHGRQSGLPAKLGSFVGRPEKSYGCCAAIAPADTPGRFVLGDPTSSRNAMHKLAPLFALVLVAVYFFTAVAKMPNPSGDGADPTSPAASAEASELDTEPGHLAVVRCLKDMDDLLDTVRDPASFAAVKPRLLTRARQHATQAAKHPDPGLSRLSRAAAKQWEQAANRHTESLSRAIEAVPAVREFFEQDIAAVMKAR
jgi:hypothetical protein